MKKVFKNIFFSLIVFILFIALFEILFSVFCPLPKEAAFQEPFFGIKWALKADYQSRLANKIKEYDHPIFINSKRLRGEEIEYSRKKGEYRILILGDSQTFGLGVTERETFSEHIEIMLNDNKRINGQEYTVINAGMPGTGTYDQMIFLKNEGVKYAPDLVILCLYINDFKDNMDKDNEYVFEKIIFDKKKNHLKIFGFNYREYNENTALHLTRLVFSSIPFYDYLNRKSSLLNFIKQRIRILMSESRHKKENALVSLLEKHNAADSIWFDKDINKTVKSKASSPEELAKLLIAEFLISRMADYSNEHGANFLIAVIPSKEEVIGIIPIQEYVFIGKNNEDINTFNLAKKFKDLEKNKLSYLFYPQDLHLSPTGHLAAGYYIASAVAGLFFKDNIFDQEKMKGYFHKKMNSTRNREINKLYSLRDYPELHYYNAAVLAQSNFKKNINEVISELKRSIMLQKEEKKAPDSMLYFLLGRYERLAGNVEDAIQNLLLVDSHEKLLLASVKRELGFCWLMKKNFTKAEEYFKTSISLSPKESESYFGLGLIYLEYKLYPKAVNSLIKANQINPENKLIFDTLNYAVSLN